MVSAGLGVIAKIGAERFEEDENGPPPANLLICTEKPDKSPLITYMVLGQPQCIVQGSE